MNASQRRKSKREFPHIIKLFPGNGWRYFDHDYNVEEARKWCHRYCCSNYKVATYWDHARFKFATEKDAVIFALKWI